MKRILFISLLALTQAHAATPSRLNGDKIEFAAGELNGQIYFEAKDMQTDLDSLNAFSSSTVTVVYYTPSPLELEVSSGPFKFKNNSDFTASATDKKYLEDKLMDLPLSIKNREGARIRKIEDESAKR